MQLWQVREPQMQRLHLRSNHIPRYPRWFALDWYLEDHPRTGKWLRTWLVSPLRTGLFTSLHWLFMACTRLLTTYKSWHDPASSGQMGIGIHNSNFTPKGFKDPSLGTRRMQVTGWIVIICHQPKQSAKKGQINKNYHAVALFEFDPNWPKADVVIHDLTIFTSLAFQVFSKWVAQSCAFEKNRTSHLHKCSKH